MDRRVLILAVSILSLQVQGVLSTDKPVYFSLVVSYGEYGYNSSGGIPAINIALEQIRVRNILPGYNLTYEVERNSKCSRTESLNVFFNEVQVSSVPKIAIIGSGCSTATEPVAEISHYWNISQISFASALSSLSDRSRFKNYFRTTPSFKEYSSSIVALLNYFKWTRLALLTENQNLFKTVHADVEDLLRNLQEGTSDECCFDIHNITIGNLVFETQGDTVAMAEPFFDENQYHVFFLNCFFRNARKLICEAAKRNLVYPHYAWIIYSFYPDKWWTEEVAKEHLEECSDQELEDFLLKSHALIIHLVPEPDDWNHPTVAGLSTTDFNTIYKERLDQSRHSAIAAHALAFDATWALGQALSYTEQMRIQIMTVNGALNDSNCSNWSRNEKVCAELSQIFQEKCNLVNINETRNATLAQVITNKTCDSFNVSYLKNLSTEDVINHANCSRDNVVQIFQDCMVKELAQYTNCEGMDGGLVPLNEFNYSNTFMGCIIRYNLQQTDFVGMSGPVRFAASGTLVYTSVWLLQERGNKSTTGIANTRGVRFGYLDRTSNFSLKFDEGESVETIFPDGVPPDGTPVHITHTYKTGVTVVFYVIALCGVVFSVVCFAFNFIFREKKVIRLTTPKLNFVIFSGAVLMYLSVFIGLLPTVDKSVVHAQCTVHVWLYVVGYLLVYGPILAKMWRVYQIFHNPTPGKKILKTWHLLCVVGGICCVGVLLILAKTIAQSITTPELVPDSEHRNGTTSSDILEVYSVWQCYESRSAPFYLDLVIFLYLVLLQIVGIILAFQTRKVKINVLNDSKSVAALVYISSIVLVVIVLVTFILRSYINISAALFSTGIIVLSTVFLILMFVPKMYSLYRDPMGEKVFKDTNPTHQPHTDTTGEHHSMAMGLTELTAVEKVDLLDARVKALESIVEEKNQKIYELINA